jgi:hypothetical protein
MNITQPIAFITYRIMILVSLLTLWGCAGTLQIVTPVSVKLANYKTVVIDISKTDEYAILLKATGFDAITLETMAVDKLREKSLFETVIVGKALPDTQKSLVINAKITGLRLAGVATTPPGRTSGAYSGQVIMVLDAELIDLTTGKIVGAFKAEGASPSFRSTFSNNAELTSLMLRMAPQAADRVAEQIVDFVKNNM